MNTLMYVLLGAVVIFIVYRMLNATPKGFKNISAPELKALMKNQKVNFVDVRTKSEMKSGVIGKPKWLELDKNFKAKAAKLKKDETYVLYCRSGRRSAIASKILASSGFENVFNLSGGYGSYNHK